MGGRHGIVVAIFAHQNNVTSAKLVRRIGFFDATMVVMGGIVGAGIFINGYVVAQQVHTPALIIGAWLVGGVLALWGGFIWAELADRMPDVGGQYAYLREAYSSRRFSLRMGVAVGDSNRRDGRRDRHFRPLLFGIAAG